MKGFHFNTIILLVNNVNLSKVREIYGLKLNNIMFTTIYWWQTIISICAYIIVMLLWAYIIINGILLLKICYENVVNTMLLFKISNIQVNEYELIVTLMMMLLYYWNKMSYLSKFLETITIRSYSILSMKIIFFILLYLYRTFFFTNLSTSCCTFLILFLIITTCCT